MSYDTKCYNFADVWLKAGGWNNEIDKATLAQLIQSLCEDFEADLYNKAQEEAENLDG